MKIYGRYQADSALPKFNRVKHDDARKMRVGESKFFEEMSEIKIEKSVIRLDGVITAHHKPVDFLIVPCGNRRKTERAGNFRRGIFFRRRSCGRCA